MEVEGSMMVDEGGFDEEKNLDGGCCVDVQVRETGVCRKAGRRSGQVRKPPPQTPAKLDKPSSENSGAGD